MHSTRGPSRRVVVLRPGGPPRQEAEAGNQLARSAAQQNPSPPRHHLQFGHAGARGNHCLHDGRHRREKRGLANQRLDCARGLLCGVLRYVSACVLNASLRLHFAPAREKSGAPIQYGNEPPAVQLNARSVCSLMRETRPAPAARKGARRAARSARDNGVLSNRSLR